MCCRWRGRLWCGATGMVSANQLSWFTQRSLSLSPAHRPRLNSGQLSCWSIVWPGRRMSQVISWVFTEVVPVISKHCSSCNILQRLRFLGSHHVVVTIWPLYSGQPTLYGWVYIWFCNTGHGYDIGRCEALENKFCLIAQFSVSTPLHCLIDSQVGMLQCDISCRHW